MTVADFLLERLSVWGVRRIYGYPGDGIGGIVGALDRARADIELVQVRHEETAALAACGHAKFTGELGVCLATSGPGAIHLLNGLYDAKLDHQPVLAIVGQQDRAALGSDYLQEVDLVTLFKDVSAFVQLATQPAQVRHLVDRAVRTALAERAVTCLVVPNDLQLEDAVEEPAREHGTVRSGTGYSPPRVVPHLDDLARAADVLNAGERVAILAGAGALHATDELIETADVLAAGVAKALLGKAALPDDLPFVTGSIGLLGTRPSWELMQDCDTFLMVGSSFPYSEFLPPTGKARGVQIDIDAGRLSLRYPMEAALVGDSAATLRALLPLLDRKPHGSWREHVERSVERWWQVIEERALQDAEPINPQRVIWELSDRLPEQAIVSADSGSIANWYARDLVLRRGMMGSLSGTLATMGCALPYALAAKLAYPHRPVLALLGDGAMQMNGLTELVTIASNWRRWSDPRLVMLVLNNRDLNQVTWEQRVLAGDPKFDVSQRLPDVPYAKYAELLGLVGIRVDAPDEIGAAWDLALSADRPALVEAITDPEVAPLPPHVTFEQARNLTRALVRDPARGRVLRQTIRQTVAGMFSGTRRNGESTSRGGLWLRPRQRR
jgi:pyruvate dehydrogenase (quinone)